MRIYAILIAALIGIGIGAYCTYKIMQPKQVDPEWMSGSAISEPVKRDYDNMSRDELIGKLYCYDTGKFSIEMRQLILPGEYRFTATLCERSAYRDIKIPVYQSENWKFYIGVGTAAVVIGGGYLIYKRYF